MYAEVKIVAPSFTPAIDILVEYIEIPTHDTWGEIDVPGKLIALAEEMKAQPAQAATNTPKPVERADSRPLEPNSQLSRF